MHLDEFLFRKKISVTDFAKRLGCSRNHLSQIVLKKIKPGKHLAKIIELETEGEVTVAELLNIDKENLK